MGSGPGEAYFNQYRPRRGLKDDMANVGTEEGKDTMVAICVPQSWMRSFVWREDSLSVSKTIKNMFSQSSGNLLTLAAYTGELERDIAEDCIDSMDVD